MGHVRHYKMKLLLINNSINWLKELSESHIRIDLPCKKVRIIDVQLMKLISSDY